MRYKAQNKDYKATDNGQAAFIGYHPASTSIEIPEHFLSRSKTFQFPSGKTAIWCFCIRNFAIFYCIYTYFVICLCRSDY